MSQVVTTYPIIDTWSGAATNTKNFIGYVKGFYIKNDGAADLTFTINGMTFTVKQNETFDGDFQPFNTVTITTTVAYRAYARG